MGDRSNRQRGRQRRNLAFTGNLINDDDSVRAIHIIVNNRNAAYRSEIIDRQSGRSRDLEVVMGSLIDDGD